jgi:hypothetical protein
MGIYMIVKSYKIYERGSASGEPAAEFDGVHLRAWLTGQGYSYEKTEAIIERIDDAGSMRVQPEDDATHD